MSGSGSLALREPVAALCARLGRDPLLVQGPGGNVSWKEGDVLWVKASGTWLAHAEDRDIFVPVDLPALQLAARQGRFDERPRVLKEGPLRPSIETILHALMPHPVVLHLHAVEALAFLVRRDAQAALGQALAAHPPWLFVPYLKPGAALAGGVASALAAGPPADVVMLANHGLILGANDVPSLEAKLALVLGALRGELPHQSPPGDLPTPLSTLLEAGYALLDDSTVNSLVHDRDLSRRVAADWALYPDHVVFLGPSAPWVASPAATDQLERLLHEAPPFVIVDAHGVYRSSRASETQTAQLRCFAEVLLRQPVEARLQTLMPAQMAELLDWDAEKFRQSLAGGSA